MAEQVATVPNPPIESSTPRDLQIQTIGRIFLGSAIAFGIIAILLIGLTIIGLNDNNDLLASLHSLLLGGFSGSDSASAFIAIVFTLVNLSVFVILAVGANAQEFWVLPASVLALVLNGLLLILFSHTPAILAIILLVWANVFIWRDRRTFRINPVMTKELRGRMRGIRAFAIITVYLGMMSGFTILLYLIDPLNSVIGTAVTGELGRVLFIGVVGVELLLIVFIVPALTSGAVTGERERKTFDLLQTTLLSPASFILGKLESALGYIFLLLLAAIPLQSIAFLFGGVSETELILAFIILMIVALTLGAVGLFFSSQTDRTLSAIVRSYAVSLAVAFVAPLFISVILSNAYANAVSGIALGLGASRFVETIIVYLDMLVTSLNPITALQYTQRFLVDHQSLFITNVTLDSGGQIPVLSPWILLTIFYLIVSATLLMLAVRRMNQVEG